MNVENVLEMELLAQVVQMKMLVTMTPMQLPMTIHVTSVERDVKVMVVVESLAPTP